MTPLYTIGHSNHPIEFFIELLEMHDVEQVTDVRAVPYSRRFPHFSREPLEQALATAGIAHVFAGDRLGGKPRELAHIANASQRFRVIAARPGFRERLAQIVDDAGARRVAIMCAEREPTHCHRALLVCRRLKPHSLDIRHILADGALEPHTDLEARLVESAGLTPPPLLADAGTWNEAVELAFDQLGKRQPVRTTSPVKA